ncbi:efflux RND transporter periplasmic adaptor subunit [Vibrio sp. RC27]
MNIKPLPIVVTLLSVVFLAGAVAVTVKDMPEGKGGRPGNGTPPAGASQQELPAPNDASKSNRAKSLQNQVAIPSVVVVHAESNSYEALITGYGEASAKYSVEFSAEVSGRITSTASQFESGKVVKKGDIFARIESISYQQAVVQAKSDLAQEKQDYLEEERQGNQAQVEWKRSGLKGEPSSALVLREPQLAVAKAELENAEISLKKAQSDLNKTVIRAPFDSLIVNTNIQPGSYVTAGTTVATLYSVDQAEIEIPLSANQWNNLPDISNATLSNKNTPKWPVQLLSSEGNQQWNGYVSRIEQHIDSSTRQRSLIVTVDTPLDSDVGLYPGTFVKALISGKTLDNTWELPASAISQDGDIWFITSEGTLAKVAANKLFEKSGSVYVLPIEGKTSADVVKRPLSSYVPGMRVSPKQEG